MAKARKKVEVLMRIKLMAKYNVIGISYCIMRIKMRVRWRMRRCRMEFVVLYFNLGME